MVIRSSIVVYGDLYSYSKGYHERAMMSYCHKPY